MKVYQKQYIESGTQLLKL